MSGSTRGILLDMISHDATHPQLLTAAEVRQLSRMSAPTLRRRMQRGEFPPPRKGGGRGGAKLYWLASDVYGWLYSFDRDPRAPAEVSA